MMNIDISNPYTFCMGTSVIVLSLDRPFIVLTAFTMPLYCGESVHILKTNSFWEVNTGCLIMME